MDGTHHPLEPGAREDQAINVEAALPLEGYSSDAADVVGRVLDGRYLIESLLGRGAMAVVLGARHVFLGKRVAIKVLHPALVAIDEMKERFLREARATSRVAHDSVVTVTDFGIASGSLYYLVMEQLEGENLLTWSERRGMASAEEVCAIGVQMCDALDSIHGAGYVHRDIKPENIWVLQGAPGKPFKIKMLDLGIAALIDGDDDARLGRGNKAQDEKRLTRAGQTLGTVLYMSPEQALGNALDGRSDIYAMGCILWELACDACAFEGTSQMDIMLKQMSAKPSAPSSINTSLPKWFDELVMKCLEKKPEDRFQTARDARAAMAAHLTPELAVAAAPVPRVTPLTPLPAAPPTPTRVAESLPTPTAIAIAEPEPRRTGLFVGFALALAAVIALLVIAPWQSDSSAAVTPAPVVSVAPEPPVAAPEPTVTAPEPAKPEPTKPAPVTPEVIAQPAQVTLTFDVQPEGTQVRMNGDFVGATPLVLKVRQSEQVARYELTHPGRVPQTFELAADADQQIKRTLALAKVKPGPGPSGTTQVNNGTNGSTVNVVQPPDTTTKPPDGTELWRPEKPGETPKDKKTP